MYYAGFWLQQRSARLNTFVRWLTFHSPDVTFTFTLSKNLAITLMNYPRLFFGGTGHLLQFFGPFMLITFFLLAMALAALLTRILRHPEELRLLHLRLAPTVPLLMAVVWLATYAVFLFFWLPSNTFYKLFCLPAIIVIIAHVLTGYRGPRRYRLALFVATMALANLAFYIFPYSRPDYNQALRFAHRMGQVWPEGTVVYYSDFIVDDWYIRYFNPWDDMETDRSGKRRGELRPRRGTRSRRWARGLGRWHYGRSARPELARRNGTLRCRAGRRVSQTSDSLLPLEQGGPRLLSEAGVRC